MSSDHHGDLSFTYSIPDEVKAAHHALLNNHVQRMAKSYAECVNDFLVQIGVTAENRHEFEFRSKFIGDLNKEVFHLGTKVGWVKVVFDASDPADGVKFVVTCQQVQETKP